MDSYHWSLARFTSAIRELSLFSTIFPKYVNNESTPQSGPSAFLRALPCLALPCPDLKRGAVHSLAKFGWQFFIRYSADLKRRQKGEESKRRYRYRQTQINKDRKTERPKDAHILGRKEAKKKKHWLIFFLSTLYFLTLLKQGFGGPIIKPLMHQSSRVKDSIAGLESK